MPLLFGRSSVGRLGLFVEITAPIGDIGFHGQWTLMLSPVLPLRVYAGMEIGQIMFVVSTGTVDLIHRQVPGFDRSAGLAVLARRTPFPPGARLPGSASGMILTAAAIADAHQSGAIVIDPYDPARLSPNGYDWRLGEQIRTCTGATGGVLDAAAPTEYTETTIPATGVVLRPGVLYLGGTHERTGSERYAQLINGDRTIGALGIWVHVSAPLGHVGHAIRWTLEIRVARPVRVYPLMTFGKIVFLETYGDPDSYQRTTAKYARTDGIDISRLHEELRDGAQYGEKRMANRG